MNRYGGLKVSEWFSWETKFIIRAVPGILCKLGFGCQCRDFRGGVIESAVFLGYVITSLGSWFCNISKWVGTDDPVTCRHTSEAQVFCVLFAQGKHHLWPVEIFMKFNNWITSYAQFSLLKCTTYCQNSVEFWLVHWLVIAKAVSMLEIVHGFIRRRYICCVYASGRGDLKLSTVVDISVHSNQYE
jgi:hypothetical protein